MSDISGTTYERGLKPRHIQFIALGGVIGVGLFLGSGAAIAKNGPGLLVAYSVAGLAIYFIMRALGEMMVYRPVSGSFASYADEFVGSWAGYVTGWSYWFVWIVVGMAEITAIALFMKYWFPELPQWISALLALAAIYGANLINVRAFGEFEFWFAIIKIATILALMALGIAALGFDFGPLGETASVSNLWEYGGFFPNGFGPVVLGLQMAMFAYLGLEVIGVTAGEARDPARSLPPAIRGVSFRILFLYVGSLLLIMMVIPWYQFAPGVSPFVVLFERSGIPAAAAIVNFVFITSAASSCNSGVFSTGRMLASLASLAERGQAPAALGKLSGGHVPARAITLSAFVMLGGVALNYLVPQQVFAWIVSVVLVGGIWTWGIIMFTHLKFRRAVAEGRVPAPAFAMPGAPHANWGVLGFLMVVAVCIGFDPDSRLALYVAPFWALSLWIGWRIVRRSPRHACDAIWPQAGAPASTSA